MYFFAESIMFEFFGIILNTLKPITRISTGRSTATTALLMMCTIATTNTVGGVVGAGAASLMLLGRAAEIYR